MGLPTNFTPASAASLARITELYTQYLSAVTGTAEYKFTIEALVEFLEEEFDVVAIKGEYASDAAAATGGVAVGEVYELSAANIYGIPAGILKKRVS